MKLKNTIEVLVLCGLMLSLFSCGEKADTSDTAHTEADLTDHTESIDSTISELDAAVSKLEGFDFLGYQYRVLDKNVVDSPWNTVDVDAQAENGDTINDAVYRRNSLVEEKLNIVISEIRVDNPEVTARTMIMADSEEFDTVTDGLYMLAALATEGYLVDLNTVDTLKLQNTWWDQEMARDLSIKEKVYFCTGDLSIMDNYGTWCMLFNKDIVQELNLPSLYASVENGTWTLDLMYEYARSAARDMNGNGTVDESDRFGFCTEKFNQYGLWAGGGEVIIKKDGDDTPVLFTITDRSVSVMEKVSTIMSDKTVAVSSAFASDGANTKNGIFTNGNALFIFGGMSLISQFRGEEVNFGIIPAPKFDEAQNRYYNTYSFWNCTAYSIPVTASDVSRTGSILEAMAEISKYTLTPAYYDVTLKGKYIRDEESAAMLDIILSQRSYDLGNIFDWGGMFSEIMNFHLGADIGLATLYEKQEKSVRVAIDKYLEQLEHFE